MTVAELEQLFLMSRVGAALSSEDIPPITVADNV